MKLDKNTLAQMIKEELEVILTDEEAVEMFGLENMVQETAATGARHTDSLEEGDGEVQEEESKIFSPNHYCVHHGGVMHEGEWKQAEAVNHNFNEELNRVTHYDMQLADGTVLENIAFEDIQVTNASLAEGHEGHTAKRDDDEDEDVDKNTGTRTEKPKGKFKTSYGHMKENNLFMTRDKLAEMVREEMARTIRRNKENA